ncbi:MAG: hypothetical protein E6G13_08265 [Actinobacteria bacterium]|nr:MAG: hypothetical protein E6G13_08265 [Actinomycetota bacterium]
MSTFAAWRPIGHVLVEAGAISQDELELALAEQRRSGRRLGEILIDSGRITWLTLANAIAEQATDMEPAPAPEPDPAPMLSPAASIAPPPPPPLSHVPAPPVTVADDPPPSTDPTGRLETVEAMLKERQRAFLELVSVTERLRANVARLQQQLGERDAEIAKLRARPDAGVTAA